NMKSYISLLFAGLGLWIGASSCSRFLNPEQIDIIYNEVFWKTQVDAEVGLSGAYALYRGLMADSGNWYSRADATTGFIRRGWNGGSASALYTAGVYTDIANENKMWGSSSVETLADWSNFYKVISQTNMVIAKTGEIPEDAFKGNAKERILGEAYFLRALTYFNIMRIWGNAPYISEMIESSGQVIDKDLSPVLIARTDDVVIGQNVLADVKKAVEYLEFDAPGSSRWGFANKGSALALSGHVNMWMHFLAKRDRLSNSGQYLKDAIAALEDFRDHSNCSYVDYSADGAVEKMYEGCSTEAVFELSISPDQNESYRADKAGITAVTCKMASFDGDPGKDRSTQIDFVPYSQKANLYPEYDFLTGTGDIRPNLFFGAWDSEYDDPVNDTQGSVTNDRSKVTWLKKYALFTEDTYRKWDEYVAYFACANIPVFRYTDVMLLLAEAYCKGNEQPLALPIVNDIRRRAGLDAYNGPADMLIDEVMQQRFAELFGEGHLYFDMVRNNYFPNDHLMPPAKYRQEGYYWPVASGVMSCNTLIEQTPYWSGKTKW
ncbi:MAG: RagB/SusD family nutrient uptake outer membrane protein, partial [Bacteroidales bacterium]|nr:RagB/SusD family nutrient uptake outer membrane protein [Bacteroidales bacterium]